MMNNNELSNYDFDLPEELIAQRPLEDRAAARMLVVDRKIGTIEHRFVRDLPEYLRSGDAFVLNNTKVLPARLVGSRDISGGRWEGLFIGFGADETWKIIFRTRGKIRPAEKITLNAPDDRTTLKIEMLAPLGEGNWSAKPLGGHSASEALEMVGRVPIPPYIRKGVMSKDDVRDYQTVYAASPGAVAAPTAGLHFDEKSLQKIADSKVLFCPVTLHVGIGTFRPISVEKLDEHIMHKEFASIEKKVVERITNARNAGGRIFALGTTSVRTLESASIASGTLAPFAGETDLFIKPPYNFRSVDLLFTNFHFPKSTLYILVRTFGGDELIERAYREAIEKKYRFFSYGDAMLII